MQTQSHYADHRDAALAVLTHGENVNRKSGQFCGQLAVDPTPLSDKQRNWLTKLLNENRLPPLVN